MVACAQLFGAGGLQSQIVTVTWLGDERTADGGTDRYPERSSMEADTRKCLICTGAMLPGDTPIEVRKDKWAHDLCWVHVEERAVVHGLDWTPSTRGSSAAQGGLPSLGKRH